MSIASDFWEGQIDIVIAERDKLRGNVIQLSTRVERLTEDNEALRVELRRMQNLCWQFATFLSEFGPRSGDCLKLKVALRQAASDK